MLDLEDKLVGVSPQRSLLDVVVFSLDVVNGYSTKCEYTSALLCNYG
jgi:hypothetical protein